MTFTRATLKQAWPYQQDNMNLPVGDLSTALPFYTTTLGFRVVAQFDEPLPSAVLHRDEVRIGLAQNGGDPTQDGCFFEVDTLEGALAELRANGLDKELSTISQQRHGDVNWSVFFVVAPDGLCFCYGERQSA